MRKKKLQWCKKERKKKTKERERENDGNQDYSHTTKSRMKYFPIVRRCSRNTETGQGDVPTRSKENLIFSH
jgi:hypothetical protein